MDKKIEKILADMPKFTSEPLKIDENELGGNYEFLVDLMNSRPLTKEELDWEHYVEHYMTCADPKHHHDIAYTYYKPNPPNKLNNTKERS